MIGQSALGTVCTVQIACDVLPVVSKRSILSMRGSSTAERHRKGMINKSFRVLAWTNCVNYDGKRALKRADLLNSHSTQCAGVFLKLRMSRV